MSLHVKKNHINLFLQTSRPRKQRSSRLSLLPTWDTELNDGDFLQTFRVTKPVYQVCDLVIVEVKCLVSFDAIQFSWMVAERGEKYLC